MDAFFAITPVLIFAAPAGAQLLYPMSSCTISSAFPTTLLDQSATEPYKRSASNGTNQAVALRHQGLFTAERSVNGGGWIPVSRISKVETDSFRRLIARVCAGEIDPRENIVDGTTSRDIRLVALAG